MSIDQERIDWVINAVHKRVSAQGDMEIRLSRHTLRVLRWAMGIRGWDDPEEFREVDAMALEMILYAANRGPRRGTR